MAILLTTAKSYRAEITFYKSSAIGVVGDGAEERMDTMEAIIASLK